MNTLRSGFLVTGLFMVTFYFPVAVFMQESIAGMGSTYSNDREDVSSPYRPARVPDSAPDSDRLRYNHLSSFGPCSVFAVAAPRFDKQNQVVIGVGGRGPRVKPARDLGSRSNVGPVSPVERI